MIRRKHFSIIGLFLFILLFWMFLPQNPILAAQCSAGQNCPTNQSRTGSICSARRLCVGVGIKYDTCSHTGEGSHTCTGSQYVDTCDQSSCLATGHTGSMSVCQCESCSDTCSCSASCSEGYRTPNPGTSCSKTFYCSCITGCGNTKTGGSITCYKSDACSCTTSCQSGYTTDYSGPLCEKEEQCSCNTECGNKKYGSKLKCYLPETNTIKPASPASITMKVDEWTSPNLSTDSNNRTLIKFPHTTTTSTTIPTISAPATSRGVGASMNINSTEHKANTGVFTINNQPASGTLTQGATGTISARNYTINKCDNNVLYSDPRVGYYKVNTLPIVNPDPNTGGAEITGNGTANPYGCTPAPKHTGKLDNKELTITVKGTDPDGNSSINGVVVWLAKEGEDITSSLNKLTYVGPAIANVNPKQIGLFIAQNGTVYKADNSGGTLSGWGRDVTAENPAGTKVVSDVSRNVLISDVRLVDGYPQRIGNETTFAIKLTFPEDSPIDGTYQLYAGLTDDLSYILLPNGATSLDQRSTKKITGQTWTFDFVAPHFSRSLETSTYDGEEKRQLINLQWTSEDNGTGIPENHTVVNVLKSSDPKPISLNESVITPLLSEGNSGIIGMLAFDPEPPFPKSGWVYPQAGNDPRNIDINIGINDRGTFFFYVTTYDKACNRGESPSQTQDLRKWIVTKGGLFYSNGAISFPTKPSNENKDNLATELLFTQSDSERFYESINVVRIFSDTPNTDPAVAKNIRNRSNEGGLYAKLNSNLKEKMESGELVEALMFHSGGIDCANTNGCYVKLREGEVLPNNLTYSGKIVIYSEEDITIGDNIRPAKANEDVLYIFSTGNIRIKGSVNSNTTNPLAVDKIDSFLIAKERVIILSGTDNDYDTQDQVEVTGGVIAFADSITPSTAISLQRSLGTFNLTKPALVVNYHPKYSVESSKFFDSWYGIYKREIGFKPG